MEDTIFSDNEDCETNEVDEYKYTSLSELYGAINREVRNKFMSILQSPNFDNFMQLISPKTHNNKIIEAEDMDDIDTITELKNSLLFNNKSDNSNKPKALSMHSLEENDKFRNK